MGMRFYASKTNKKKLSILYHRKSSLSKANSTLTTKKYKTQKQKIWN